MPTTTLNQLAANARQAIATVGSEMQAAGLIDANGNDLSPATIPSQAQLEQIDKSIQVADAAVVTFNEGLRSIDPNAATNGPAYDSLEGVYNHDSVLVAGPFLWDDQTQRVANSQYDQNAYKDLLVAQFPSIDATVNVPNAPIAGGTPTVGGNFNSPTLIGTTTTGSASQSSGTNNAAQAPGSGTVTDPNGTSGPDLDPHTKYSSPQETVIWNGKQITEGAQRVYNGTLVVDSENRPLLAHIGSDGAPYDYSLNPDGTRDYSYDTPPGYNASTGLDNTTTYAGGAAGTGSNQPATVATPVSNGNGTGSSTATGTNSTATGINAATTTAGTPATVPTGHFSVTATSSGQTGTSDGSAYTGPVSGIDWQFISTGSAGVNVTSNVANVFIKTGPGNDALRVTNTSGRNVLDGGTGSNFMVGSTASSAWDTFFVDDRSPATDIWTTIVNAHKGDDATIWGVTRNDFQQSWFDGQGAAGYTGLTLHATAANRPTASLTLTGYTSADLLSGRLGVSFGTTSDGNNYMEIKINS